MGVAGTAGTVASWEALIEAVRAGERVKYLHFWGTGRCRTGGSGRAA